MAQVAGDAVGVGLDDVRVSFGDTDHPFVVVEDCGRMINPAVVDGQVHGSVAQGVLYGSGEGGAGADGATLPILTEAFVARLPITAERVARWITGDVGWGASRRTPRRREAVRTTLIGGSGFGPAAHRSAPTNRCDHASQP